MKSEHKEEMKRRKRNICLTIAYDGTDYAGFQRQSPPIVAVQNVLEKILPKIFGDTIELAAAGRTDAGVHARGQVVNFFTDGSIPLSSIPRAANCLLPPDIVVLTAREAGRDFSALHSAKAKTYIYRIQQGEVADPLRARYAWHIAKPLNVEAMQRALFYAMGTHDFSAFKASGGAPHMCPVRSLYEAICETKMEEEIQLRFFANGFLYHMVRNLVGTLVDVGKGRLTPADFGHILDSKDRKNASPTAPAKGLCLFSVEY